MAKKVVVPSAPPDPKRYQIWERPKTRVYRGNTLWTGVIVLGLEKGGWKNEERVILRAAQPDAEGFIIPRRAQKSVIPLEKFLKGFKFTGKIFSKSELDANPANRCK
jgi:hypothetical protein